MWKLLDEKSVSFLKKLRRLIFYFIGKPAYSKNSSGKMWHNKYFIFTGNVNKGDMIFLGHKKQVTGNDISDS